MRQIVSDARVADFVGERTGEKICEPYTLLGIEDDGRIVAGVVFNGFTGLDIEVTVAGDRSAFNRAFLKRVGNYIFGECKCLRISVTTEQEHVVDLADRLGGQIEGVKRNRYGPGRDGIILGILREEWIL